MPFFSVLNAAVAMGLILGVVDCNDDEIDCTTHLEFRSICRLFSEVLTSAGKNSEEGRVLQARIVCLQFRTRYEPFIIFKSSMIGK